MTLLSEMLFCLFFLLTLSLQRVSGQENYVEAADCKRIAPNGEQPDKTPFMSSQVFSPSFLLSLLTSHLPFLASKLALLCASFFSTAGE